MCFSVSLYYDDSDLQLNLVPVNIILTFLFFLCLTPCSATVAHSVQTVFATVAFLCQNKKNTY